MSDKFKYKTEYIFDIYATTDLERDLDISTASLETLRPFIPKSVSYTHLTLPTNREV